MIGTAAARAERHALMRAVEVAVTGLAVGIERAVGGIGPGLRGHETDQRSRRSSRQQHFPVDHESPPSSSCFCISNTGVLYRIVGLFNREPARIANRNVVRGKFRDAAVHKRKRRPVRTAVRRRGGNTPWYLPST